jgi:hypothetical protein
MKGPIFPNILPAHETEIHGGQPPAFDHTVQFYTDDTTFLDSLAGFIAEGINAGESVIVIATPAHRLSLEFRLRALGFNVPVFARDDRYISIDAQDMLSKFIIDGSLDERIFKKLAAALLARARKNGRQVRAFGEMVALLWERGNKAATLRLENLWDDCCHTEGFSVFCAYPRNSLGKDAEASIKQISSAHSKVIAGSTGHAAPRLPHPCHGVNA